GLGGVAGDVAVEELEGALHGAGDLGGDHLAQVGADQLARVARLHDALGLAVAHEVGHALGGQGVGPAAQLEGPALVAALQLDAAERVLAAAGDELGPDGVDDPRVGPARVALAAR